MTETGYRPAGGDVRGGDVRERSTAELVQQLSELVPQLMQEEITLAKREMREKGKRAGTGAGLFGGGGLLALYGMGALVVAIVLALAEVMRAWASALIVGVVLLAVAGILALVGRKQASRATPPVPEQAMRGVRQDMATVKESARR